MTNVRVLVLTVAILQLIGPTYAQSSGGLMISEIMQNPESVPDGEGEYVELYNPTSTDISLSGFTFTIDSESDRLTTGTVPAGGFAVLCVDGKPTENGGIDQCTIDYPDRMSLKNEGSTIVFEDSNGTELDRVQYDGGEAWPDPNGASMEYIGAPGDDTNDAANWEVATTRRGMFDGTGGDFGSPGANAPGGHLPVELSELTITADGSRVSLSWVTASETENAGFLVEHRAPGEDRWERRGFVKGQGTTSESTQYRFERRVDRSGRHTFRVSQVDVDGSSVMSGVRSVQVSPPSLLSLSGSNPISPGDRLTAVVHTETRPVHIRLYNVLGQCVRTFKASASAADTVARIDIPTAELASGTYFLRARRGGQQEVRRFTVVQ